MRIGNIVSRNANRVPEKTAIVFKGEKITYRELNNRINRFGNSLMELGVKKGDRVGILERNGNEFVESYYATQKIGAIITPINFRHVAREIKYALDFSESATLIFRDEFRELVDSVRNELKTVNKFICIGNKVPSWSSSYYDLIASGNVGEPMVDLSPEDPSIILFSGGTTGNPKGVVHTHRSAFATAINAALQPDHPIWNDVHLLMLPLFHGAGLHAFLNLYLLIGATVVIMREWSPAEAIRLMGDYGVTTLILMPSVLYRELFALPEFDEYGVANKVRYILTSGGSFPLSIKEEILRRFPNAKVSYSYGLTEGGPTGTFCPSEQLIHKHPSIGLPVTLLEVKVVNEYDEEVAFGEVGEIILRGPTVGKEYYRQPELTKQTWRDGWCHTGDLAKRDEDGFIYFVDRLKDMIKSGGENVYPKEIEDIIMEHPKVKDVAVIGVPDPVFLEGVKAFVVLKDGERAAADEIISFCKQHLASYKKPRYVEFVDSLPRNPSGKVLKTELRKGKWNIFETGQSKDIFSNDV
jgi:acyl-CoA synthetase (AMP-forming)/AMP-acid ligase II